jgi:hypothetical protein
LPTPATPAPVCSCPSDAPQPKPLGVHARNFNKLIASQRACVERTIAHLKNWRILAYGYRRLTANFPATLAVVTNLEIYRTSIHASSTTHLGQSRSTGASLRGVTSKVVLVP